MSRASIKPWVDPSSHAWNVWINFVLYALSGRMQQADALMRAHRDAIRRVAAHLQHSPGATLAELWRGLLLEPKEILPGGEVATDPQLTFLSWTEDMDVACYFADPRTMISGDVLRQKPSVRGYVWGIASSP